MVFGGSCPQRLLSRIAEYLPQTAHQLLALSRESIQSAECTRGTTLSHTGQPTRNIDCADLTDTVPSRFKYDFSQFQKRSSTKFHANKTACHTAVLPHLQLFFSVLRS